MATLLLSSVVGVPKVTPVASQLPASAVNVTSAAVVSAGFSVSVTVSVWVAVALLPEPSVTVQVTVVDPRAKGSVALLVTLATVHLSSVVGVPTLTPVASQLPASAVNVTSAGAVIVGFSVSVTVTVWVAVALLPEPSVTVQVTVVDPRAKGSVALLVTLATVQLSSVVWVDKMTPVASQLPASAVNVTSAGAVIGGFSVSVTVTVWVAVARLPEP